MLRARVVTALVLLGVFLVALFLLADLGWTAFVALAIGLAAWEWAGLGAFGGAARIAYALISAVLIAAAGAFLLNALAGGALGGVALPIYGLAAAFWLALVPLWLARKWRLANRAFTVVVGWLVLLPAGLALVQLRAYEPALVLGVMAGVWAADIAAYFTGRAFGRHKLAPGISPGKTWEGVGGAMVAVTVYGFAVLASTGSLAGRGGVFPILVLSGLVVLTALSIIGDLFESLLKRQAGMKDSGRILPGHGGVLDRIDSLTSTLPLLCMLFILFNR
jgi:phosphatidate cytidylyltransferase